MIIYRNKHIPVQGFKAFFFCGILFVRGNAKIDDVTMNHERIHSKQYVETDITFAILLLPLIFIGLWWLWLTLSVFAFYIWYIIEWLIRLFMKGNAYRNISFEREAYSNEDDVIYLEDRKRFAWFKYLKN